MNQLMEQLQVLAANYSTKQKMVIAGVFIFFLSAAIAMVLWANRTEYEVLYSNLDPSAASSIISDLRSNKIPYKLENGGTTILAPAKRISELRLKYVQSGFIKDAVTGYELFEGNNMGMTTFMQHLNFKRALEGELMRTINQFPEVKQSRVHLVIPEDRLFENEKHGSASVVLYLKPGAYMTQKQLKGIATLVANSVDGLEPKDVAVMDDEGKVLLEGEEDNTLMGSVGDQYELRNAIEQNLQKKVLDIVSGVVGRNNAVVKVSAELNFDRIERVKEEVDPESRAVLSEEKYVETSTDKQDTSSYNIQKTTSNYELTKIKETYVSNTGNIKRLTVAVLVNGKYKQIPGEGDQEAKVEYEPRNEEELNQIAALVKSAVGYDEDRGDVVEVQNMKLETSLPKKENQFFTPGMQFDFWEKIITYVLLAIGMLLAFFLLKGMLKNSVAQLALPGGGVVREALPGNVPGEQGALPEGKSPPEEEEIPEDLYMKKLSPEARAKLKAEDKMTREVLKFAEENPEDATKLLRSWITNAGTK